MTHTPGPWHVAQGSDDEDFIVAERTGNTVCEPNVASYGGDPSQFDPSIHRIDFAESKANARLIAAAPELLTVAQGAWYLCQSLLSYREGATDELIQEIADALHAAIAKAEEG